MPIITLSAFKKYTLFVLHAVLLNSMVQGKEVTLIPNMILIPAGAYKINMNKETGDEKNLR
ncbi:hypothetical protein [Marinomonas aquiplantarum]|uniref:Uncharacterized protein n=1 Tax=Marinomonas aquiplantarum TaxID=491951 RepID=A0A366CSK0_9GAMM|nr:hypothetical protein [Marinomonas aquiplantarum]RBO78331.1 hypothetical protein DFP76_1192 [Marinomonas aquiplantarum]